MGPRGNGKSTELAKLATRMNNTAMVVNCSIGKKVNVNALEPVDVVFATAATLLERVAEENFLVNDPKLADLENWLRSEVVIENTLQRDTSLAVGTSLKNLLADVSLRFQAQSKTRETIRPRLYTRVTELAQRINEVGNYVAEHLNPPLLLVEDLDKTNLTDARKVFLDEVNLLKLWDFKAIYSFPIALRPSNDYTQIRANFQFDFKLPNMKINDRFGNPDESGRATLRDLALKRADQTLFGPGSLERAIELCGGLASDYVRILQNSFLQALVAGVGQITVKMVDNAASEIRNDFRALLLPEHYEALRTAAEKHTVVNSQTKQEILHNLSLLEYHNDEDWSDAHPIVKPLLDEKL
jgi:hypothetical protein